MSFSYNKTNNLLGWGIFVIAAFTYLSTAAPTVSFWDCGEYIATSVKLQVGHPPGAPLFQLMGNLFSQFAFGNVEQQARMVNTLSALSSAFTILFLFWTITALGKKFMLKHGELTSGRQMALFGGAVVGALTYTWSDSFWFSAVEGEVYAMSSFFTALAVWSIIKWEKEVEWNTRANRWIIFIAFVIGLSIGVHILVFLAIPAVVMVYFFKVHPEKLSNLKFIWYNIVAVVILGAIFAVIIPLVLNMFGKFEIFFVNTLGLPFNSGTIFTILVLGGAAYYGLWYTRKKGHSLANTLILSTIFILLGYSTFLTLAVRSNANTPIDENNPEDAMALLAYYNREQYGSFPVFYGQYFNAPLDDQEPFKDGNPVYRRDDEAGKYVVSDDRKNSVQNFADSHKGIFPRMWNVEPQSIDNYKELADLKDPNAKPPFGKNLKFFFNYQIGHMWWRYFMWNFAGRQNDFQHRYEKTKGNWLTGINFLDRMRLGPQDNLPYHMKNNPARNTYYLLPFILGLVGLYFHFKQDGRNAWVVTLIFLFTGLAIAVYLNHKPFEPRERDYAYVGSFYAFAMWIGIGVMALFEQLKAKMRTPQMALALTVLCGLAVPALMAKENWDDHDRSERYIAREIAKDYLDSCAPNAILFTNGDNDTFPLWYIQEVEGYRTDVRVVNLSLLNTSWYIDQQKRAAYDAEPVPFSLEHDEYKQGTRDVLYFQNRGGKEPRWRIEDFMRWIKSTDPSTYVTAYGQKKFKFYPTRKLRINIDKNNVLKNMDIAPEDTGRIVDYIDWRAGGGAMQKNQLMVADLLANNDWSRPIYFSVTVGNSKSSFYRLTDYFELEGLAYRFVPYKTNTNASRGEFGEVDTETLYTNLMEKFSYGNIGMPGNYLDETARRTTYNLRNIFGRLAQALADEGQNEKAIAVLDKAREIMPEEKYQYNYFVAGIIEGYYKAGAQNKAREMVNLFADRLDKRLAYYKQFSRKERKMVEREIQEASSYYNMILQTVSQYEYNGNMQELQNEPLYQRFQQAVGSFRQMGR